MAFKRFTTKLQQAVTKAEKTVTPPELKEALRQFEETKSFGDNIQGAIKEAEPNVGTSSKFTKVENLGALMKHAAAKYGTEKPEALGLQHAGDILMAIGKEERGLLKKIEDQSYAMLKATHDFHETLKKETKKMENAAADMDGANINLKSGKDAALAESCTQTYEAQKTAVEGMAATLPEHRDKQRQAAKALLQAQLEFYTRAAQIIEGQISSVGG